MIMIRPPWQRCSDDNSEFHLCNVLVDCWTQFHLKVLKFDQFKWKKSLWLPWRKDFGFHVVEQQFTSWCTEVALAGSWIFEPSWWHFSDTLSYIWQNLGFLKSWVGDDLNVSRDRLQEEQRFCWHAVPWSDGIVYVTMTFAKVTKFDIETMILPNSRACSA